MKKETGREESEYQNGLLFFLVHEEEASLVESVASEREKQREKRVSEASQVQIPFFEANLGQQNQRR